MRAGDVVLLNFPFSDLSDAKLRPGVVLAVVDRDDFIAVQITSKEKGDAYAVELSGRSFAEGGLRMTSFARAGKLFTAHRKVVVRRVAQLSEDALEQIRETVIRLIRRPDRTG
jgi:mRNA interferase MazF